MKSGFVTILRATVMLAVLVGLPLLALRGTDRSLSELITPVWEQVEQRIAEFRGDEVAVDESAQTEALALSNDATGSELQVAPAASGLAASSIAPTPNPPSPNAAQSVQPFVPTPSAGRPSATISAVRVPGNENSGADRFQIPPKPKTQPTETDPSVAKIETRLRELGASHYMLERWGDGSELFRFRCEMSLAGHPDLNRHFEATDASPVVAMTQVLEAVDAWRGATARRAGSVGGTIQR